MRLVHAAQTQPCYECRERADVAIARGHRIWYCCWDHAQGILENGGIIVGGDLDAR